MKVHQDVEMIASTNFEARTYVVFTSHDFSLYCSHNFISFINTMYLFKQTLHKNLHNACVKTSVLTKTWSLDNISK